MSVWKICGKNLNAKVTVKEMFSYLFISLVIIGPIFSYASDVWKKFFDRDYMSNIDQRVTECQNSVLDEVSTTCLEVNYLHSVYKTYLPPADVGESKIATSIKSIGGDEAEYSKLFETYIAPGRPFKGSMMNVITTNSIVCNNSSRKSEGASDCSDENFLIMCDGVEEVYFPNIVSNNYLVKLNSTSRIADTPNDLTYQLPSVLKIDQTSPSKVFQCPNKMHQVIWGNNDISVTVRLMQQNQYNAIMQPISKINHPLHYPIYENSAFSSDMKLPKYIDAPLLKGEYIFIPNTFVSSIKSESDTSLLRLCFVDASNYGKFIESITIPSKIFPAYHDYLHSILVTLTDKSMSKYPLEKSITEYYNASSNHNEDVDGPSKPAPGRRKSNNKLRDWQDTNKWNTMITSLTIPQPNLPSISYLGRNHVIMEWFGKYLPLQSDRTKYGYNITMCSSSVISISFNQLPNNECSSVIFAGASGVMKETKYINPDGFEYNHYQVKFDNLSADTQYFYVMTMFYDTFNSIPTVYSPMFTSLPVDVPLSPTNVIVDDVSTFQVRIGFDVPKDNGGSAILHYKIFAKCTEPHDSLPMTEWTLLSDEVGVSKNEVYYTIQRLLPGTSYEFRVVAVNNIGMSKTSLPSNVVTTSSSPVKNLRLHGYHDSSTPSLYPGTSIELDTSTDVLTYHAPSNTHLKSVNLWKCHWSPSLPYTIVSRNVWADPLYVDSVLTNGDKISGNIAWVIRGKIGLVHKVIALQKANALAVIIVDNGKCVSFNQACIPGADKSRGENFALKDMSEPWENIRIPVYFMLYEDGIKVAETIEFDIPKEFRDLKPINVNNDEL